MSEEGIDYWEALFNKKYLRWFHLNGKPSLVEIVRVERDVEMTLRGGHKEKKPVLHVKQVQGSIAKDKPLVLNTINGNEIATIHGPQPSGWPGKRIVLFRDDTEMYDKKARRNVMRPCIRVRAPKN